LLFFCIPKVCRFFFGAFLCYLRKFWGHLSEQMQNAVGGEAMISDLKLKDLLGLLI
jgi:hypothetical protein